MVILAFELLKYLKTYKYNGSNRTLSGRNIKNFSLLMLFVADNLVCKTPLTRIVVGKKGATCQINVKPTMIGIESVKFGVTKIDCDTSNAS